MVSEDIKDMLIANSSLGLDFGSNLFIGREPSSPDNTTTIFDTGGTPADVTLEGNIYRRDTASIQVKNNDYQVGYQLASDIEVYLIGLSQTTWNGVLYTVITSDNGVSAENWDDNGNSFFIIHINIQRR